MEGIDDFNTDGLDIFYEQLLDKQPVIFYLCQSNKLMLNWANEPFLKLLGYTEDEISEHSFESIFEEHYQHLGPGSEGELIRYFDQYNSSTTIRYRVKHKAGQWSQIQARAITFFRCPNGKANSVMSIGFGVSGNAIPDLQIFCMNLERLRNHDTISSLTPRELEIIQYMANGELCSEIARKLKLSKHTVSTHRKNILRKLQFSRVSEVVAFAVRNGLDKYPIS